ncbi:MAG: asparagine synthase (glutamine-hydrolyzing) [Alphaproteobacteria bacterium]
MCGFTGFLSKNANFTVHKARSIAFSMLETLHHRGPDAGDIWQDPEAGCVLGHRRLSILDLSEEGAQPMMSASGRYVLSYNGEIYNFQDIRKECEDKNIKFRGRSDTEIMLAAIELWGLNQALQKFNGMFAFALWDRKERILHLVRDRMGKKPLYVGWAGNTLVFGSELKALTVFPGFKREINKDALALYLNYACMQAPHCIYQNVWQLPAGHRLSLSYDHLSIGSNLSASMEQYWSHLEVMNQARLDINPDKDDAAAISEFEDLLGLCVSERMISDVPLGAFLSGGIDSSSVVALMQKQASSPVKTYSIGFKETGFDEAVYAKKIARHLGTEHHELYLSGQDALDVIPHLSNIYDEPFGDSSAIPTYLVSKFARNDVTVALSGDGGDEMLGGYNRHFMGTKIRKFSRPLPSFARRALARILNAIPVRTYNKILKNHPQAGTRIHKIADILRLGSDTEIYSELVNTGLRNAAIVKEAKTLPIPITEDRYQPEDLDFAQMMMYWDTISYLPNDILVKVDRASMAVSLEARSPLLDKRVYEYCWSLPHHMKIRNGKGKWLLREVLARHVPRDLFERPKQGFAVPVGDWLRDDLKDWAETLLDEQSMQTDDILNTDAVQKIWEEHKAGRGNNDQRLWTVLMFQSWKEKWL